MATARYINPVKLLSGPLSCLPFWSRYMRARGTGSTAYARYCYSVWLRHLTKLSQAGFLWPLPTIAELGPGDSIGVGLAALISGADRYFGLDVIAYSTLDANIVIFDELVELFQNREGIPDDSEFPKINPKLSSYKFPTDILSNEVMERSLDPDRLQAIRNGMIQGMAGEMSLVSYQAPWDSIEIVRENSVDIIFSQAVLEHVDSSSHVYRTLYKWLKPGGLMSHTIDFSSHGYSSLWNGHWTIPAWLWKVLIGKRTFSLNRNPHSVHLEDVKMAGFSIVADERYLLANTLKPRELANPFKNLSEEDLNTKGAYLLAKKEG